MKFQSGQFAEVNNAYSGLPLKLQVIAWREIIDTGKDPLIEVEFKGRRGCVHLSDLDFLKANINSKNFNESVKRGLTERTKDEKHKSS